MKHHTTSGKRAKRYYRDNIEELIVKARDKYGEEDMTEENKQRLKKYQRDYRRSRQAA